MSTTVGSIKFDLSIDGSGLSAEIVREIQAAIAPALADLHRRMDSIEHKWSSVSREAEASGAKQTSAAQAVAEAVEKIGEKQEQSAAKTAAAAGLSTRSINAQTRALDKQLAALDSVAAGWAKVAAAQSAAAAAPTPGGLGRGGGAVPSVDALEKSTRGVSDAQRELNAAMDIFGRKSPQIEAFQRRLARAHEAHTTELIRAAAASRASADSQIGDYQRLAREAELSAARQAAASAAAGGGGGRGGGGGGGNTRWHGGTGGFLTSPLGVNAIALGVGSLPAAATVLANLTGAVQQLLQAGALLPGMLATAGASLGTFKLGTQGVGDAVSAMWKAFESGDAKDIKKVDEALKNLAPSVKSTVKAVAELFPEWQHLKKDIAAENMFEGVEQTVKDFSAKTLPTLERGLGVTSKAWNNTIKELGRVGGLDSSQSILDKIFGNTAEGQNRANKAIEPLVHGLGTLMAESSDFIPRLGDGLTAVTTRFDNFISKSVANGNLDKWINQGIDAGKHLGETFLNLGKIIASITKAAGGDGGFLKWLDDASTKLSTFLASDAGQATLTKFFTEGREQLKQWGDILKNLGPILQSVFDGMKQWSAILLPVLTDITGALSGMPGLLTAVVTGFLAWRTMSGVMGLLGLLTKVGSALDGLPGRASKSAGGIKNAFSGIKGIGAGLGLGLVIDGVNNGPGNTPVGQTRPWTGGAETVGGATLTGASLFGLPGAIAGFGIGATIDHVQRTRAQEAQIAAANQAVKGAWTEPQKRTVLNDFYGTNIFDPSKIAALDDGSMASKFARQQFIDRAGAGDFKDLGIDGSNIQAELSKVINNAKLARDAIKQLGDAVTTLPSGEIILKDPTPQLLARLHDLGLEVQNLPDGKVAIDVNTDVASNKMRNFIDQWSSAVISPTVAVPGQVSGNPLAALTPSAPRNSWIGPGHAGGGVIPGYSPGVDDVLWPLSGGEGILIPEAVRALGPNFVYGLNAMFRPGLRRGFAGGGINPDVPGGLSPIASDVARGVAAVVGPMLDVLSQIRDILSPQTGGGGAGAVIDSSGAVLTGTTTSGTRTASAGPITDKKLREADEKISDLQDQVDLNKKKLDAAKTDLQREEAEKRYKKSVRELNDAKSDQSTLVQGGGTLDFKKLPFGDPRRVMAGVLTGLGVSGDDLGAIISSGAQPIGQVVGDVLTNAASVRLPGPLGYAARPTAQSTGLDQLAAERNPLFFAQGAGFNVADYTRQGGGPGAQNLTVNGGPPNDATGRIYSDTAALIDRTFSNQDAVAKARHDQQMTVLNEIKDKLSKDALGPVVRASVTGGIDGIGQGTTAAIGTAMGQAAAAPIAQAVASAVPSGGSSSNSGATFVNTAMNVGTAAVNGIGSAAHAFGSGGVYPGYAPGVDSILSWVSPGEGVLIPEAVRALGGAAGIYAINSRFRAGLSRAGYAGGGVIPRFANGGPVDASATVGADFFGVSQVPILGALVNLLVAVLLKVIGVQIQARDTLTEISSNFREFRGDFKSFDASGRLLNDTSGLTDRSSSSEQEAADERLRILKLVLEGLLKFIIEQIIVPIAKAVAQSVINIGAQLASGAIQGGLGAAFPGGSVVGGAVGGVVSSLITGAGNAAVDIIASVGTTLAESLIHVGLDAFTQLFQSAAPDLVNTLFSGALMAHIFDPITSLLTGFMGAMTMVFGGAFSALGSLFDDGGLANGVGLMPKATIAPERVLSPQQTMAFERLVDALTAGNIGGDSKSLSFGDLHFHGSQATPDGVRDTLLDLISG